MEKQTKTILYIDDDPEMIELISIILSSRGFSVVHASGGREGLEMVAALQPDLILLDLMMPDVDGWGVYSQLKRSQATSGIPVIILTARAQKIDKVLGLEIVKVDDYLSKPFSPQELLKSIENSLAKTSQNVKP